MSITVMDVYKKFPDFGYEKMKKLTGKSDFEDGDTIQLSRIAAFGDKNLSIFAAEKEGKPFVNTIQDDNMKAQIADASGIKTDNAQNANVPAYIPMDKSVFDYQKPEMA